LANYQLLPHFEQTQFPSPHLPHPPHYSDENNPRAVHSYAKKTGWELKPNQPPISVILSLANVE
jgi:hypothetical protein